MEASTPMEKLLQAQVNFRDSVIEEQQQTIVEKDEEIKRLKRERQHMGRVAIWFCENEPGELVPDWCDLYFQHGEPVIDEADIEASEKWAKENGAEEPNDRT